MTVARFAVALIDRCSKPSPDICREDFTLASDARSSSGYVGAHDYEIRKPGMPTAGA
jgi:hypothetical protein